MNQILATGANNGGTDEWYTPDWAVDPIVDFLPRGGSILCPFDTKQSAFYRVLTDRGYKVETSHISEGVDFFKRDLRGYDYVISNPPYSLRDEVLTRLYDEDVPFAMLVNTSGLLDSRIRMRLAARGAAFIYIYPRVMYATTDGEGIRCPFQSCYWTRGILPDGSVRFWERQDKDQIQIGETG